LEDNFSRFAKIRWMPSWFAKLLELLLWEAFYSFFQLLLSQRLVELAGVRAVLSQVLVFNRVE
jgi:hypothetical protein